MLYEVITDCGIQTPFEFVELDPLYTVNFRGENQNYYLYKNVQKLAEQFADKEPDFENKFRAYLKYCESLYNVV